MQLGNFRNCYLSITTRFVSYWLTLEYFERVNYPLTNISSPVTSKPESSIVNIIHSYAYQNVNVPQYTTKHNTFQTFNRSDPPTKTDLPQRKIPKIT